MGRVLRFLNQQMAKASVVRLGDDPRETPIYGVTDAAYLVGVPRGNLRHWLKTPSKGRAIIETPDASQDLSFYNLLEAHILRVASDRNVDLKRVRDAVATLRERSKSRHPLLELHDLFTAQALGLRSLFIEHLGGHVEDLGHSGQFVFSRLIKRYLSRIDIDASGPYRLRPMNFNHVALDHRVAGGRPVVLNTGILIEMIARRHRAGETIDFLARDYKITRADVRDAIKYSDAA